MHIEQYHAERGNTPPSTEDPCNQLVYVAAIGRQKYVANASELGTGIPKQGTTIARLGRRRANIVLLLLFVMGRMRRKVFRR